MGGLASFPKSAKIFQSLFQSLFYSLVYKKLYFFPVKQYSIFETEFLCQPEKFLCSGLKSWAGACWNLFKAWSPSVCVRCFLMPSQQEASPERALRRYGCSARVHGSVLAAPDQVSGRHQSPSRSRPEASAGAALPLDPGVYLPAQPYPRGSETHRLRAVGADSPARPGPGSP